MLTDVTCQPQRVNDILKIFWCDFRPLLLLQGIDCKDWTILQDNTNYVHRKIQLLMRRRKARKLVRKVIDWCVIQMSQGRYFLIENPATSRLWLEADIQELLQMDGVYTVICHSGAYGGVNSQGQRIKKSYSLLATALK